ncbi:MAG: CoA-binding protein [Hyphomicrobiales bacterium]|nr:MAG: CoA-binding protein [Hyphomicrobiales bacterium]
MAEETVGRLLSPKSIAIIGASSSPGSLGSIVLSNLESFDFAGDLHLVNPRRETIGDRPCIKSVSDLPLGVDCAILAIPRAGVVEAVAQCAEREVGSLVIFSAGFAEESDLGRSLQEEVIEIARKAGMSVVGPNCLGLINFIDGVPLTFSVTSQLPESTRPAVGVLSQSGAMATVVRAALTSQDVGITLSVSTGNEAVNGVEDFLGHLIDDASTQVIAMVVEQFRSPEKFLKLARRAASKDKPIVLLHPGRSREAQISAQSHTGALTGDYDVMRALVADAGVLIVDTLEELVDLSEFLVRTPTTPRGGLAVITDSGAFKAQVLDLCDDLVLALPAPSTSTREEIDAIAPGLVRATNPLDLTAQGGVDPDLYRKALTPLLADDGVGSVLIAPILSNPDVTRRKMTPLLDALAELAPDKLVVLGMLGGDVEIPEDIRERFKSLDVPFLRSPERALRALAHFHRTNSVGAPSTTAPGVGTQDHADRRPGVDATQVSRLPEGVLAEYEAKRHLAAYGLAVPEGRCVSDLARGLQVAAEVGYPIALKAQSTSLAHKSDVGGVVLNICDEEAFRQGWGELQRAIERAGVGDIDGVLVERMAPRGVELIIGARNDPAWGPVLVVGLGGILAEAVADVRVLPAHADLDTVVRELRSLRGSAVLNGFRGAPPADVPAAAAVACRLGGFVAEHPEIVEVDLNPVVVFEEGQGALVLDALIVTTGPDDTTTSLEN